jgi:hypothetical protein
MSEQESKIDDGSVVPKSLEGAINWIPDDGSIAEALRQSMSSPPYCCSHYGGNPEVSPKEFPDLALVVLG